MTFYFYSSLCGFCQACSFNSCIKGACAHETSVCAPAVFSFRAVPEAFWNMHWTPKPVTARSAPNGFWSPAWTAPGPLPDSTSYCPLCTLAPASRARHPLPQDRAVVSFPAGFCLKTTAPRSPLEHLYLKWGPLQSLFQIPFLPIIIYLFICTLSHFSTRILSTRAEIGPVFTVLSLVPGAYQPFNKYLGMKEWMFEIRNCQQQQTA